MSSNQSKQSKNIDNKLTNIDNEINIITNIISNKKTIDVTSITDTNITTKILTFLGTCNDYPEREYTQASGSA